MTLTERGKKIREGAFRRRRIIKKICEKCKKEFIMINLNKKDPSKCTECYFEKNTALRHQRKAIRQQQERRF